MNHLWSDIDRSSKEKIGNDWSEDMGKVNESCLPSHYFTGSLQDIPYTLIAMQQLLRYQQKKILIIISVRYQKFMKLDYSVGGN